MVIQIDQLIRSRRRSIGLQITKDARLIVRAPYFAPESYIEQLVAQKERWIKAKQEFFRRRQALMRPKKFSAGEEFLFLGKAYPLIISDDLPKAVVFEGHLKISSLALARAADHLECWYKHMALEHFTQRVKYYASMSGLAYRSIRLSSAISCWGSCGYRDTLNFTWRLIMAPPEVVDYVVIHELMHIRHKNHSVKFWAQVAAIMPDYRLQEMWLKQNGHLLEWFH